MDTFVVCDIEKLANVTHIPIVLDGGIQKDIFIYDDHRTILNILFIAFKENIFKHTPNLIFFDRHDDAVKSFKIDEILEYLHVTDLKLADKEIFLPFVEYKLSSNDDDWLTAALELDLINNVVNIGNKENNNISQMNGTYLGNNKIHDIYSIGFEDFTSDGGVLDEKISTKGKIRSILTNLQIPYILDFDIDCFASQGPVSMNKVWTEEDFNSVFNNDLMATYIESLISQAEFVTICREPLHCGGIGCSNKLLSLLDECLFNGELNTEI